MKRIVIAALAAVLSVGMLAPPASAHAVNVVVKGHVFPNDLTLYADKCSGTGTVPSATQLVSRNGSLGTHTIGWQFAQPITRWSGGVLGRRRRPQPRRVRPMVVHPRDWSWLCALLRRRWGLCGLHLAIHARLA